mmetsp:Transcript_34901/g.33195  ORF Transcript_34901/g.33195 Transcript_34901/m.33195 type:complete len:421 (-) Transcript_34901:242-1504(-)|eukprot:CAMPEP_0119037956 /NCGR_PEP_ID=MMETSP1177-20130426/6549_1 /TAXON_ID=2985 /ORGANISM="Ochromonas sp, Strain CCMP1899" /LENGTH=420 /DNA_ID=CAMNT_0006999843 /DNA_START=32 /DNA_END=1294 /DNA_ORIENTATION=+
MATCFRLLKCSRVGYNTSRIVSLTSLWLPYSRSFSTIHQTAAIENPFTIRVKSSSAYLSKLQSKRLADGLDEKEKELGDKLSRDDIWDDSKVATELSQDLAVIRERLLEISNLESALSGVLDMYEFACLEEDKGIKDDCYETLRNLEDDINQKEIESLMSGPYDKLQSCFIQINAGAGGTDSCDYAGMLFKMYHQYAVDQKFNITIIDENYNDEVGEGSIGYRSVTMRIRGNMIYGWMKAEAGIHRLVRISPFDPQKKRHTSFIQVLVYPEITPDSNASVINIKDLRIDVFRSNGAGGQNVQKTESAVRLTHIPTGIVASCQNERSQHQNKATAMSVLQSRLDVLNREKQYESKQTSTIGVGDISWGNQIRSIVMQPYQMVKDHRTGWETGNIEGFMNGGMLTETMTAALKHLEETSLQK